MKKLLFALFFTVLSHYSINAQKEFMAGYIVNNTGDTIRGEIDNQKWAYSPLEIVFKNQNITKYELRDIQSFVINNEVTYVRKRISLDVTPHKLGDLLKSYDRILVDTTLFLKQLVKGRLSLYYLLDKNSKDHFFIQKLNEPMTELIDHRFLRTMSFRTYEVHLDTYNKQLYDLCEDCSNYAHLIFKYQYSEADLTPLVMKYNIFFGDNKPVEVSKKEKFKSSFFLHASIGTYSYNIDQVFFYYSGDYNKSDLKLASLGVGVLFDVPSKRRRLGLRIDFLYNHYQEDIQFYKTIEAPPSTSYLSAFIGPQYSIYKNIPKKIKVYFNGGLSLEKRLSGNSGSNTDLFYQDLSNKMGYKLGVGVRINKLNAEFSYSETGPGLKPKYYTSGNIQKLIFTLSYVFGEKK